MRAGDILLALEALKKYMHLACSAAATAMVTAILWGLLTRS
jgi:hypothetical protein